MRISRVAVLGHIDTFATIVAIILALRDIAGCPTPVFFTVAGEGLRLIGQRVKAGAMSTTWKLDAGTTVNPLPPNLAGASVWLDALPVVPTVWVANWN